MIDETMDIPSHWFAVQLAIADKDGLVPHQERDVFQHFCSQKCVVDYVKSDEVRERLCSVNKPYDENENENENGDENENENGDENGDEKQEP